MVRQRQPTHRFKTSHAEEAHHLAAKLVGATDAPFDPRHMLFRRLLATTSAGAAAAITASAALAQPKITLYEYGTTRSTRCRWTLKEAGLAFDALDTRPHKPEVLALNPIGKLPVAVIDGGVLTESAAISTHLADVAASTEGCRTLIAPSRTIERAQHDQWVSFALTELDAWRWHSFIMERVTKEPTPDAVKNLNDRMWTRSVRTVVEPHVAKHDYLVGDAFSCADIVVGWSLNWGRRDGLLDDDEALPATRAYLARLLAREHCALNKE